jgi:septal ring factor EnvC (AmiA/AmiB activator)
MKAGTLIFLIVVILIAFGYVASDDFRTHQEVQELKNKINELKVQVGQAQIQLITCQDRGAKDAQTIRDLEAKIGNLDDEIKDLNKQLARLNAEIALNSAQKSLLDLIQNNPLPLIGVLMAQVATSTIRYSKQLGIKWPGMRTDNNDYVRLSREERARLISARRARRNSK